ncbi:MAG: hypothetical protein HF962_03320 [Sulfurovum sp.]|nr:hypothetical protein [Sulfurovum sp.]
MQMVRNILILLVLLPLAIMLLMPKKELYYLLEKKLHEQNIIISQEKISEGLLSLNIEHPVIYFSGTPLATAENINLWSLLFYTKVDFKGLMIAQGLVNEIALQKFTAVHSMFSPLAIAVDGESSLGDIDGKAQLRERVLRLNIAQGGEVKAFSKYLKKSKEGWFYESKF